MLTSTLRRIIGFHAELLRGTMWRKVWQIWARGWHAHYPSTQSPLSLCVFLPLIAIPLSAPAQASPVSGPPAGQTTSRAPTNAGSSGAQATANATASPDDALDNPVLEQADEERNITYMQSRIAFKYNHDEYDEGANSDEGRVDWLQSFGPSGRMAAGIELPFAHFTGGLSEQSGGGLGDIKLEFRGMLGKSERFEHAAGCELTVPSASNDLVTASNYLVGEGETVIKPVWGFSASITPHTLLSGELGYNKALHTSHGLPGMNNIEPELIITQAIGGRTGGYLDWDTYYDFNVSEFAQTLKIGLDVELDRKDKWSLSAYFGWPLNHFTQTEEFKNTVGTELSYYF